MFGGAFAAEQVAKDAEHIGNGAAHAQDFLLGLLDADGRRIQHPDIQYGQVRNPDLFFRRDFHQKSGHQRGERKEKDYI
ncbi:MAG: hypothetical protein BWY71_01283 [Planctomycetes bacterium ADurb.Bin412]|nr:MAG: hypothetical protein BWY71_01283 [Planctomycetes bacterium ADurb.Bin412]